MQVPMTYCGAPLAGAEARLMGTMEHSVLGQRWVYDACADPVYASGLATAILQGGTQADEFVEGDAGPTLRVSSVSVKGSGSSDEELAAVGDVDDLSVSTVDSVSTITAPAWALEVRRIIDVNGNLATADPDLVATWAGQTEPVPLASARRT